MRIKKFSPLNAEVAASFHPEKNPGVDVVKVSKSSRERYWWLCEQGHEWESTPHNRSIGRGCPVCSGRQVVPGVNDLDTTHPRLAALWSKKNGRSAREVVAGSEYLAEWICALGHEWVSKVSNLTQRGDAIDFACPVCSNRKIVPGFNDVATTHPHLVSEWSPKNTVGLHEVSAGTTRTLLWECASGHEWSARVADRCRLRKDGCGKCSASQGEKDLISWMESLGVEMVVRSRGVIAPYELDIYLPEVNIAVEFNGVYWHSELFRDRKYHLNKTVECSKNDIQLIHIWEDDWMMRQDTVKSMLLAKMGLLETRKIPARKCVVERIDRKCSEEFLDAYHLQGGVAATYHLGLFHDQELVAVMALTDTQGDLILDRYATGTIVQGGFRKLLSYVERNLSYGQITTYADLTVSDGKLYESSGFTLLHITRPDYHYVYRGRRVHKFNFRKSKFKSNPELLYEEGLTERQLAALNKLPRIYDCGKKVYVKSKPGVVA